MFQPAFVVMTTRGSFIVARVVLRHLIKKSSNIKTLGQLISSIYIKKRNKPIVANIKRDKAWCPVPRDNTQYYYSIGKDTINKKHTTD